jgi:hypothetical protein
VAPTAPAPTTTTLRLIWGIEAFILSPVTRVNSFIFIKKGLPGLLKVDQE